MSNISEYDTLVVMSGAADTFTFESADGVLAYRDTGGTGRSVVLLHAGFLDSSMFDAQLPVLRRRYRVIAPDARGHGESDNATQPFRQSDDLAALLRHISIEPAFLVGVSMGAMIAVDTAIDHPELVSGLVIGGRGIGEPEYRDGWSQQLADTQADALACGDIASWLDSFLLWAAGPYRPMADVDPTVTESLRHMASRTLAKHTTPQPDFHLPIADGEARAETIAVPVLAVDGALDSPDLTATVDRLLSAVPDARRTTIDGAGHFPNMEQPAVYNRLIEEFVEQTTSPG
ncbi:alpha/beta fold hydrolase [Nocardia sp. NPDC059180]|uniref:alpha/beta fold hydrolase n=1 Tax=Nocardia sp. NPDC059180 TaxID=3346761 RepID=UPI0036C055A5